MSTERVTVSITPGLRAAAAQVAEQRGLSFSSVVASALGEWLRGQLVDEWLAEHQAEHGAFTEGELRDLAAQAAVPYLPPGRPAEPAP
ncbi:MAG: hypothetical protein ACT4PP_06445 [Sporichthyaceae bacterium]